MTPSVIHQPRVAWDGARAFVAAAGSEGFGPFADLVGKRLDITLYGELAATRERLLTAQIDGITDEHAAHAEVGVWRARLDDLLRRRPELLHTVRDLISQAPGTDGPEPTGRN
jgi:hypothetical protein